MCSYTYSSYCCGCDYIIWWDSVEVCGNRSLSGYDVEAVDIDMCPNKVVSFEGICDWYCDECSEDYDLEYELDE